MKRQHARRNQSLPPPKALNNLSAFQDERGRVAVWPSDRRVGAQQAVLRHLAAVFEGGRLYDEREVQTLLRDRSSIDDLHPLMTELVEHEYLQHDAESGTYWLSGGRPTSLPTVSGDETPHG